MYTVLVPPGVNQITDQKIYHIISYMPVPGAARSKAWVYGRSPAAIVGSNPTQRLDICVLWVLFFCQVEVSATDW